MNFSPLMTCHQRNYCITKKHIRFDSHEGLWPLLRVGLSRFYLAYYGKNTCLQCQTRALHGGDHVQLTSLCYVSLPTFFHVFFLFVDLWWSSFLHLEQKLFSLLCFSSQVQTFCLFIKQHLLFQSHYFQNYYRTHVHILKSQSDLK